MGAGHFILLTRVCSLNTCFYSYLWNRQNGIERPATGEGTNGMEESEMPSLRGVL